MVNEQEAQVTPRVAFVVQRCGSDVNGGAEQHCLAIAKRMTSVWECEVLTTCALDYMTWSNHFPPGDERIDGLRLRRFPVERPRDVAAFNRLSESIRASLGNLTRAEEEDWMRAQGPWSPGLFDYLRTRGATYDAVIFFTYLYTTTYFGLPLVADRAFLVPTAHDEWPIYLGMWNDLFARPRGFIFNTVEEKEFLQRRFPLNEIKGPVVGVAVEPPETVRPEAFRERFGLTGPFVLYVGRVDASKGVDRLVDFFKSFRERSGPRDVALVIAGRSVMTLPSLPYVHEIGFIDEQTKWDAMAAASVVVMPSPYESLSMALLEAWSLKRPVLVNGDCDVLIGQCRRAQGGLWYREIDEFVATLSCLLNDPATAAKLGQQGYRFVSEHYRWSSIVKAYRDATGL